MPKVGMEPIRKAQLIEATLESVELYGLQNTTVATICKIAGMSPGIISHYFGGKQQLIEATVSYLIKSLQTELLSKLKEKDDVSHKERLYLLIDSNFSQIQTTKKAAVTWLSFWAQAAHDPSLRRLQCINERRLFSNIKYSMKHLVPADQVDAKSHGLAAMIDGLWIRSAFRCGAIDLGTAPMICKEFVDSL
ncbi:transcriptional regulator BetI [Litoribrevibacter albus]|uniref:HTH-type transcriptional regulator BetI n=1 Tax=Litoribrevibacter albus TaxID=1473156 RepID=A0AA37W5C5_9GAMM|nr:transcriptional regulator BetI [Litoribrevibacter albus]GLQ30460.1 HTH-type transcriptional regulator BetI [Litoribrevibacter albus]